MISQRRVSIFGGDRFGWICRLAAAVVLAVLSLVAGGGLTMAAEDDRPDAVCCDDRSDPASRAAVPLARFDPAERKSAVARAVARQEEPAGSPVDRVLDQGRALVDRYGGEKVLLAVVVGALVQVLSVLLLRFVGRVLGLVTRVLAWGLGAAVAVSLLNGGVELPTSADEALHWMGRLTDLIGLVV